MTESQLIYVTEMAGLMGRTETAIRNLVSRRSEDIPPPMKIGGRICWRRKTVDRWFDKVERKAMTEQRNATALRVAG